MTQEPQGPALVRDDELTTALRAIVAPPADPSYWDTLEQRIQAKIDGARDDGRWWALPDQLYQIGLVAAGLTLILAGSLFLRSRAVEATVAYESVIENPAVDQPVYARRERLTERQATLRAVTGH